MWWIFFIIGVIIAIIYYLIVGINNMDFNAWYNTPIKDIRVGDILLFVLIISFIGRTNITINNGKK